MKRLVALVLAAFATAAPAQDAATTAFPVKPVRVIVPFTPGGPNDLAIRPVAQKLTEIAGHPFVVDYRPGANGTIGTDFVDMLHVPYKGAAVALADVMGGHADSMFISAPGAMTQIKAGKVRVLATASGKRAPSLPEAPTFAEAGFPDVFVDTRYGVLAAGTTPGALVQRLNALVGKALASSDVRERYAASGLEVVTSSAQDYQSYLRTEIARWRKVVTAAKIQPQ